MKNSRFGFFFFIFSILLLIANLILIIVFSNLDVKSEFYSALNVSSLVIAFVSFIILFLIRALKFITTQDKNKLASKAIIISGILAIMGVMTHGLFDTIFFRPQVQFLFWTIIAMCSAILINEYKEKTRC